MLTFNDHTSPGPGIPASEGVLVAEAPWGPIERKGLWPRRPFVRRATFELPDKWAHGLSIHSLGKRHSTNVDLLGAGQATGSAGKLLVDIEAWADSAATLTEELRVVRLQAQEGWARIGIYSDPHTPFPVLKPKISVTAKARLPRAGDPVGTLDVYSDEGSVTVTDVGVQAHTVQIHAAMGSIYFRGVGPSSASLQLTTVTGSVEVKSAVYSQDVLAESKLGSLNFFGAVHASASARLSSEKGSVNLASVYAPITKLTSSLGQVQVCGQLAAQDLYVESDKGSVLLQHVSPIKVGGGGKDESAPPVRVGLLARVGQVQATFMDRFDREPVDPAGTLAVAWSLTARSETGSVAVGFNESFAGLVKAAAQTGSVNLSWRHKGERDWVFDHKRAVPGESYEGSVFFKSHPLNTPEDKYLPAEADIQVGTGSANISF